MQLSDLLRTYSDYSKQRYGEKVFRVGVSTGIECPHRKQGGCIFCNPASFRGAYQSWDLSIEEQLEKGIRIIREKCGAQAYIAYFQDETSTAGELSYLEDLYKRAFAYEGVKGLALSTRPDYVNESICEILSGLEGDVTLEIGLQSIHEKSLEFLNRGHSQQQTEYALDLCKSYGIRAGVHVVIGIPGESEREMLETVKWISGRKEISEVKFHNLVVYLGTKLAELWQQGLVSQIAIEDYIEILSELIAHLREDIVISRLFTSNILHNDLAAVKMEGNKTKWMNMLRLKLIEKNYKQGCECLG